MIEYLYSRQKTDAILLDRKCERQRVEWKREGSDEG